MDDAPARLKTVRDRLDRLGYIRVYQAAHPLELGLLRLEVWAGSRGLEMIRSLEVGPALALRFFELRPSRLEPLLTGAGDAMEPI